MLFKKNKEYENKQKVCPDCKNNWREGDLYCRYCGAKMTDPSYIEFEMQCIYGPPPMKRTHTCKECGYSWTTNNMIDREEYCPKCGGSAPYDVSEEELGW